MPQKPLSEMFDKGYDNMGEESGYVLSELKAFSTAIAKKVEEAATLADLQAIWKSAELLFAEKSETSSQLNLLSNEVEKCKDLKGVVASISNKLEELGDTPDNIATIVSVLETKADQSEVCQMASYFSSHIDHLKCYTYSGEIAPADVLTLNATPIELVGAPGAGKMIEVVRVELFLDYEASAYTAVDAGKDLSLEYATSGQILSVETTGFLDQASDQRRCQHSPEAHPVGEDEALTLKLLVGEIATGDSPLKLSVDYRIVDLLT